MAELLRQTVAMTSELERRLDGTGDSPGARDRNAINADPVAAIRIQTALLLRKARIHAVAALRANETSNLHSLAVQMRPALECAGQIVFFFRNAVIAPGLFMSRERAVEALGARLNADHFQTLRRGTRGRVTPEELREEEAQAQEAAAASVGAPKPKRRKARRLDQADKVAPLQGGRQWYRYLSEHFSHGKAADWKGLSWRGGVMTIVSVESEFAFLGMMSYLVEQVAVMNAAAALCPAAADEDDRWNRWVEPTLVQLRHVRQSSKALVGAAKVGATGGRGDNAGTD